MAALPAGMAPAVKSTLSTSIKVSVMVFPPRMPPVELTVSVLAADSTVKVVTGCCAASLMMLSAA